MSKIRLTKKGIVIISVLGFILLGAIGGGIYWYVVSAKNTGNLPSLAGECRCSGGELVDCGGTGQWCCDHEGRSSICNCTFVNETNGINYSDCGSGQTCTGGIGNAQCINTDGTSACGACNTCCGDDRWFLENDGRCTNHGNETWVHSDGQTYQCQGGTAVVVSTPTETPSGNCHPQNSSDAYGCSSVVCEFPEATYCMPIASGSSVGNCQCISLSTQLTLGGGCRSLAACTPPQCPDGWSSCGTSETHDTDAGCMLQSNLSCRTECPECSNPSYVYRYCRQGSTTTVTPPTTTIVTTPPTTPPTTTIVTTPPTTPPTTVTTTATPTATPTQPPSNPNWDIRKNPVLLCVNENTANVAGRVTYTVNVTYTNTTDPTQIGTLTRIIDRPQGIRMAWLVAGSINRGGVAYASTSDSSMLDRIEWTLSGDDARFAIPAGQVSVTKSAFLTYSIEIPNGYFATYYNTVMGYPNTDNTGSFGYTAQTIVTCQYTGLFDSTASKIMLGAVLLVLSFVYLSFEGVNPIIKKFYLLYEGSFTREGKVRTTRKRFEKKMTK